jgi:hypothetical protein
MITILVGDITNYLAEEALRLDQHAKLITQANSKNLYDGVYYTSLGDFEDLYEFVKTLEQAHHLIYCPPKIWSDHAHSNANMEFWTECYLLFFLNKKQISGQDKLPLMLEEKNVMLGLSDVRKAAAQQLWIAGCSISHGTGVDSDQRYGQLLAQKLDLPVSFLTGRGSSVQWAADQILRSDVRAGDIVVWGVTSFARMPFYSDRQILPIRAAHYDKNPKFNSTIPIERLDDDNIVYRNLASIHAVINFCAKAKARLFLFGLLVDFNALKWTADLPNYTQLYGCFGFDQGLYLDVGTDHEHPGPQMHAWYCDQIFTIVKQT